MRWHRVFSSQTFISTIKNLIKGDFRRWNGRWHRVLFKRKTWKQEPREVGRGRQKGSDQQREVNTEYQPVSLHLLNSENILRYSIPSCQLTQLILLLQLLQQKFRWRYFGNDSAKTTEFSKKKNHFWFLHLCIWWNLLVAKWPEFWELFRLTKISSCILPAVSAPEGLEGRSQETQRASS